MGLETLEPVQRALKTPAKQLAAMRLYQMAASEEFGGEPGSMPPERELAARLGVSRTTLRDVLRQLAEHGLAKVTPGKGWQHQVRSSVPMAQSRLAAMLSMIADPQFNPHHRQAGWASFIDQAVFAALRADDYHVLNLLSRTVDRKTFAWLRQIGAAGLVLEGAEPLPEEIQRQILELRAAGTPVVCDSDDPWTAPLDRVVSDHRAGAYAATTWLIQQGCRRIQRVWTSARGYWWRPLRDQGHEEAMHDAGLATLPVVDLRGQPDVIADAGSPEGFQAAARLLAGAIAPLVLAQPPVDALMLESDHQAFWAAAACRLLRLQPGRDVLIAGYDDYAHESPQRSMENAVPAVSVNKRNGEIGRAMADLFKRRRAGTLPSQPQRVVVRPDLAVRLAKAES